MSEESSVDSPKTLLVRRANERGLADYGWLVSRHTFSFGEYYDPAYLGFRSLRVINDDRVSGGRGFGAHPHRDMEILSYVVSGALEHRDSLGNGSTIHAGELQRMTAGTGIRHSEYNASEHESVHFLQIWIEPSRRGLNPSYEQVALPLDTARGRFTLVGASEPGPGRVSIHQDVNLYLGRFDGDDIAHYRRELDRHLFAHIVSGKVQADGIDLEAGDAVYTSDVERMTFSHAEGAEVLLFDLG